jgi:two-component system, OmpR family, sensor kinase
MRPPSLARRIIVALLVYQTVASLLGATFATMLDLRRSDTTAYGVQFAIDTIAAALRRTDEGLVVEATDDLARLAARNPGFWYAIHDGRTIRWGGGPAPIDERHPVFANGGVAMMLVDDATGGPILAGRPASFPVPAPLIVIGGVTTDVWVYVAILANLLKEVVVYVLLPLTLGAALLVGWVIRRVLVGVETAATAATQVQPTTTGRRIPETGVPREVLPLVTAFNAALARLDEGRARQRRFIADAAHELRTPIAILSTRLDQLPDGPVRALLQTDVRRLSNLARQLLETESVRSHLAPHVPLDLVRLARDVAADLAPGAMAAGYTIAFESERPAIAVLGDEGALRRAVANLIENAIRHAGGSGAITVAVRLPARVVVCDEGPGIPPASRERIFEPFFRGASSGIGAGLGLSLVREIAQAHGGDVRLMAGDGTGAHFELDLHADGAADTVTAAGGRSRAP